MRTRSSTPQLAALVVAVAVALAGCGGEAAPSAPVANPTTLTPSSTRAPTVPATSPPATAAPASPSSSLRTGPVGSTPGTQPVPPAPGEAPCSTEAVKEALTAANLEFSDPARFSCEGIWAFAYAVVPKENSAPPQVALLQANGPRWAVVDKATACTGPSVAPTVRQVACVGY